MAPRFPILALVAAICATAIPAHGQDLLKTAPVSGLHFLQYGVAMVAQGVATPGDICPPEATAPCILGPGLGVSIRMGYRTRGAWFVGGTYQVTRHDSSSILRLAVMQQVRGQARYFFDRGLRFTPYATGGFGAAFYGNEWGAETGGPTAQLGAGFEYQVTTASVLGAALTWQPILMRGWTDSAGQRRADRYFGFGVAQMVGLELVLELKDALPRF